MPTGRHHWDITTEKNICSPFEKSIIKFTKVLQQTVVNSIEKRRLERYTDTDTDTDCLPQTDSRSSITYITHVAD
jgi:hypothetical protein